MRLNSADLIRLYGKNEGKTLPRNSFYVIQPGWYVDSIDIALKIQKKILFTLGIYHLDKEIIM